jgi:hypothetical protein
MLRRKGKTLDDARKSYLNGKITKEEYAAVIRKNLIGDHSRREIEKRAKKIERRLKTV